MNAIRMWSMNIVAVSFIACILRIILPQSNLSGGVVLGINLLVMLVILAPFGKSAPIIPAFHFSTVEIVDFQVEDYTLSLAKSYTEKNIRTFLTEIGIKEGEAVIDITMKTDEGNLVAVSLAIAEEHTHKATEVKEYLTDSLQVPVTVSIIKKEEDNGRSDNE